MTFKRPSILKDTIHVLLNQSLPPSKILIVDNDPDESARTIAESQNDLSFEYLPIGFNSGPAGAAYYGCKKLYEEGWEYILWIDDDDPPIFGDQIENNIALFDREKKSNLKVGITGSTGVLYNRWLAQTKRVPSEKLLKIQPVDMIAGNQHPIISREVLKLAILPNQKLFFGFEDLEFCLRVKKAGFQIVVDGDGVKKLREFWKTDSKFKNAMKKIEFNHLWRVYYSSRSITIIQSSNIFGLMVFCLKGIIQSFLSYRFGFHYGTRNLKYRLMGILHGLTGKSGLVIPPSAKY